MSTQAIRERYTPVVIAADSTNEITNNSIGGFLCSTDGTITLIAFAADGKAQTTLLTDFPVTAGIYYPLPFYLGKLGGSFSTVGAAGVLGV